MKEILLKNYFQFLLALIAFIVLVQFNYSSAEPAQPTTCPDQNNLDLILSSRIVGASSVFEGNKITYYFSSLNRTSSGGIPGLSNFCVYLQDDMEPYSIMSLAHGANGDPFVLYHEMGKYFAFGHASSEQSNIALDGAQNVMIGSSQYIWMPQKQKIVLQINDQSECSTLYGPDIGPTCFVTPGLVSEPHIVIHKITGNANDDTEFLIHLYSADEVFSAKINSQTPVDLVVPEGTYFLYEEYQDGWTSQYDDCQFITVSQGMTGECMIFSTDEEIFAP